ncbi:hypothetical protein [Fluviicola taffensis]|uniref:Uncharacterized protein n=1 Tax=Fluviicola taffensis (strain DSM 16823 / NCIMB 13979 / RW262) TaxID=755732 RepID=F2IB72_FLUTR|nr:hypothetical protein [Fluviicola taffensis]AEA42155.1 hypothetical protein Fluta_0145 [Fluviicola taffensis DSM 16823]
MLKKLKLIGIEFIITIISMVTIIRSLMLETKHEIKILLLVGIGLSLVYMIHRIWIKLKEEKEKSAIREIVCSKMIKSAESFLYYIDLILINHPDRFNISNPERNKYVSEKIARNFFEVDFRIPDPYTGTSMGNLAEQVDFGMKRGYHELEKIVSRYSNKLESSKLKKIESLSENLIFKSLVDCKLWFDQITMFNEYAIRNNPTFPKNAIPITISMDFDQHRKDYIEMINLIFEMKECFLK